MPSQYQDFVLNKFSTHSAQGLTDSFDESSLFPFQALIVGWALRKGRAAIFADTGLGKTRMQLVWADTVCDHTGGRVLILAPLAVAEQTRREGETIGIAVTHARTGADVRPGINITNYDRLHLFDPSLFIGIVLDESSIIKHHDAKTLTKLMAAFADTPYRLCATATPAPNDWTELGTHAEFLGVCSRSEMLAEYFLHDGGETQLWRLKGHARKMFWRWVATWGALIRSPADLGFDASAYELPPLRVHQVVVESDADNTLFGGGLFSGHAATLSDRRLARRLSMPYRVAACAERVNATNDPTVIWCELNAEGDSLGNAIYGAVEIRGSDSTEEKEKRLVRFANGEIKDLITKPKIAGFGLNWQHCASVHFIGVIDSFESYYQAVRRCWRFGQTRPVDVYLYVSEQEGAVAANLAAKEEAANKMFEALSIETRDALQDEIIGQRRVSDEYQPKKALRLPSFLKSGE